MNDEAYDNARALDGNAIAGLLTEIFAAELTSTVRGCGSCGQSHPVGRHRLYRGAGLVLRCPGCDDVALTIVERGERHEVRMSGRWALSTERR
jgi:Family of unknown function (DUF6510)